MKVDILAMGAHPDDVELSCGGTLLTHVKMGKKVAIVDLTMGELGTRGTPEMRIEEANNAAAILGASVRENLGLKDGFIQNDEASLLKVVAAIRKFQPTILLANAKYDRHPDHAMAATLAERAAFLAGLKKIETHENGEPQAAWRPTVVYHYIQSLDMVPDFVVNISDVFEEKMKAVLAFKSQFYDPNATEPNTFISSPEFLDFLKARAINTGLPTGFKYAEGFQKNRFIGVNNLFDLV